MNFRPSPVCSGVVVSALVLAFGSLSVDAARRDRIRPSVSIESPAVSSSVAGAVLVMGTAADNIALQSVSVSIDDGNWVPATGTSAWAWSWDSTAVGNGIHTVIARAVDTSGNFATTSVAVVVDNPLNAPPPPPSVSGASGQVPVPLPLRFTVGLYAEQGDRWMPSSGAAWDTRYRYFTYGWANNWGWSAYDGSWGLNYLNESSANGQIPVVQYYVMNGLSNYDESKFLATAQSPAAMTEYFNEWKILMERVRDFGEPAVILVEGDGFGFLEQQSGGNPNAYAAVSATGIPELLGLPDTIAGWGMAFLRLRDSVGATNAVLAMDVSGWATSKDLLYFSVTDSLSAEVDKAYAFLAPLGLAPNATGSTWDLLANDPLDRDSDYYTTIGQNRWWDPSDTASISSASFNRYAEWLHLWNSKSGKRWMLWQVPIGNSNHKNVYNNGNPAEGYKDNRAEYFFGDDGDLHRQKFVDAGVIGILFGPGAAGQSFYTNDTYTDGQLFLKSRAGSFLNGGGMAIN